MPARASVSLDRDRRRVGRERLDAPVMASDRFAVVSRRTLPEEIASRLLGLVRLEELRPGDKLPPERDLAQMMDVSRPVLREALRALALMRVVDIRQGDGTYITSLEPKELIPHLDFVFSKDSVALVQLLEARRVVETGNVRLAAPRVAEPELARLEALSHSLAAAVDDPERFSELDIAFHDALCDAAENVLLSRFMEVVSALEPVGRERTGGSPDARITALRDHGRILDALRAHDPGAAEQAMQEHLDHVERALRSAIAVDPAVPVAVDGR